MILPFSWTPKLHGADAVSELIKVKIRDSVQSFLIRGENRQNPVILFVHGGPGCSEIPYVVKYQRELEKHFTIVHYDQRGSGKSYQFGQDYSDISVKVLADDLQEIIDYVCKRFDKKKIILAGHSFGTTIAMHTIKDSAERIAAYIGIGQMVYTKDSEIDGLSFCMEGAEKKRQQKDYDFLLSIKPDIEAGKTAVPRSYVRKYGGASRLINDNRDYITSFLLRPEYSVVDVVRFVKGLSAARWLFQTIGDYAVEEIMEVPVPCYFLQGRYDYMTSTRQVKKYFEQIQAPEKKMTVFEKSAHFPQFEEKENYLQWLLSVTNGLEGL